MKRIILSISALAFLLTSCSNEEGTPMEPMTASELKLVTTSNTTGKVSYSNLLESTTTAKILTVNSLDADGAYFNSETDEILGDKKVGPGKNLVLLLLGDIAYLQTQSLRRAQAIGPGNA